MKKLQKGGSFIRGLMAGIGLLAGVTAAHAHPYASSLTNISLSGSNYVQFVLNEGATGTNGVTVTVVTYPSTTTNVLGTNVPAGTTNFFLGSDTSYTISCTKLGAGAPTQTSTDGGNFTSWPTRVGSLDVNHNPKFGDSFGRIYMGSAGQSATPTKFRSWGVYGITPDLQSNALYGGNSPQSMGQVVQLNTLTFTAIPTNGATWLMDGTTNTWTNAAVNVATQIPIGVDLNTCATNLANAVISNAAVHLGTLQIFASNNVVYMYQVAQNVAAESYYSFANPINTGTWASDFNTGNNGFGFGPYRLTVGPDDNVYATDATEANANIFVYGRNGESTNQVFTVSGRLAGEAVQQHGNLNNVAIKGSLAQGNLQLFTADNDLAVPNYFNNTNLGTMGNNGIGNFGSPQETVVGDANELYRYDIGAGPLPCTNTPKMAATLILDGGFPDGQVIDVCLGPPTSNTNLVYASGRRANYSDGNLQVFRQDTGDRLYTSLNGTVTSPADFFGSGGVLPPPASGSVQGDYAGPRVSPDGRFIAVMTITERIVVANLTNGIPDESSAIVIIGPAVNTGRELAWDAADNLYLVAQTASIVRSYSLGISTTCVTSNDVTLTNGSFQLILPPASVSLANAGNASQNYGTPIAGAITFNAGTHTLPTAVPVTFTLGGTATNGVNYTVTTGNIGGGVIVTSNSATTYTMTFPQGSFGGAGNWTANLTITPTASPLIGPTLTVSATLNSGPTYISQSPIAATVSIANTGPQFFFVSASPTATTMSRAIPGDYARFIINRWGDLAGPGVAGHLPTAITLTNFALAGTAAYSTDYLAGVQVFSGGVPSAGNTFSVSFAPGVSSITNVVGLPVSHANVLAPSTNATIVINLTNSVTGTNGTSQEGSSYFVNTATVSLTEFDNALGTVGEIVLWHDDLTNASANYAVTFASTNLAPTNVLPVYIPNYIYTNGGAFNGSAASLPPNSNCFDVMLGFPVTNENALETTAGVGFFGPAYSPPVSPFMAEQGWSNVMRLTVNKQAGSTPTMCGLNVFPTTQQFVGNYALRFDMYLSIWSGALNNIQPLNFPRQFAAFGIGTQGTNCDWRLQVAGGIPTNTGSAPTNADGMWYCVDAGDQSLTPADFDGFVGAALPNQGVADTVSGTAFTAAGIFKRPPFPATDGGGAGTPINQWVSVSVESTSQTNVNLVMDNSVILSGMAYTNTPTTSPTTPAIANQLPGFFTNGIPMFGYLQPYSAQSDESAFVYFSHARIVELSPYIVLPPQSQLVMVGSNVTFNSAATYASAGLTNKWMSGTTVPANLLSTATTAGTNLADTITLNNVQLANGNSNYWSVYSDLAGSVTSYVATLSVVAPPSNVASAFGSNATITVTSATRGLLLTFQWQTNGVNIANGTKYSGVTNASMVVTNVSAADTAVLYDVVVSERLTNLINNFYVITNVIQTGTNITTPGAAITIATPPSGVIVTPLAQTNIWGSSATFTASGVTGDAPISYAWKRNGTNLANTTKYSGTNTTTLVISNLTQADSTNTYQVYVSNPGGSVTNNPAASLVVFVPQPTLSSTAVAAGHVTIGFGSTNTFDKTNSFILQSAPLVTGPYTNTVTNVVFSGSAGSFSVTAPTNGNNMFYRLLHVN